MTDPRSVLNRLSAFVAGPRFSRLSTGIVIALCDGLLLPVLVGAMALTRLRQDPASQEYVNGSGHWCRRPDPLATPDTRPARADRFPAVNREPSAGCRSNPGTARGMGWPPPCAHSRHRAGVPRSWPSRRTQRPARGLLEQLHILVQKNQTQD